MISLFGTAWVLDAATRRVRPSGAAVLAWRMGMRDSSGGEHVIDATCDLVDRIDAWEPLLTRGRVLVLQGELRSRTSTGRHASFGQEHFCHVVALEFPDRTRRAEASAGPLANAVKSLEESR